MIKPQLQRASWNGDGCTALRGLQQGPVPLGMQQEATSALVCSPGGWTLVPALLAGVCYEELTVWFTLGSESQLTRMRTA